MLMEVSTTPVQQVIPNEITVLQYLEKRAGSKTALSHNGIEIFECYIYCDGRFVMMKQKTPNANWHKPDSTQPNDLENMKMNVKAVHAAVRILLNFK